MKCCVLCAVLSSVQTAEDNLDLQNKKKYRRVLKIKPLFCLVMYKKSKHDRPLNLFGWVTQENYLEIVNRTRDIHS